MPANIAHHHKPVHRHHSYPHEHIATHYSGACDGQSNVMADGTTIDEAGYLHHRGRNVDDHALASSFIATGTVLEFSRPVYGSRVWTVRDSGGAFDLYRPNCWWGPGFPGGENPNLHYRILR